jgi:hypothetical protein
MNDNSIFQPWGTNMPNTIPSGDVPRTVECVSDMGEP